jgi:hypothetical protein
MHMLVKKVLQYATVYTKYSDNVIFILFVHLYLVLVLVSASIVWDTLLSTHAHHPVAISRIHSYTLIHFLNLTSYPTLYIYPYYA